MNTANRIAWFKDLMKQYKRIALTGGSKGGKTTLSRIAEQAQRKVFHSDDFKVYVYGREPDRTCKSCLGRGCHACHMTGKVEVDDEYDKQPGNRDRSPEAWSQVSQTMMETVNAFGGPFVVEGTRVPHALRKGMAVDVVVWLEEDCIPTTKGQAAQKKGCRTVLNDWAASHPDVPILRAPPPLDFSVGRFLDAGEDLGDVET